MPKLQISLADGTYAGPFEIAASGTAENPIVIRGASQAGTVLDGHGCDCNLLEIDGSFVHVERLTLQNGLRGLRFKTAGTQGNVARRVHIRDVTIGVIGDPDQQDFYLCDNVLEGGSSGRTCTRTTAAATPTTTGSTSRGSATWSATIGSSASATR